MVDDMVNDQWSDTVKPIMLEPREWYDHAITDVVMDMMDGSLRVVYDRSLLVRWTAMMFLYDKNKYKNFEDLTVDVLDESQADNWDEAAEHVDYNTIRAISYMGPNRPFLTAQTNDKW